MSYVNKQRLQDIFFELVSNDCESFYESTTADYLKNMLEDMGIAYTEDQASEELKKIGKKILGCESKPANNIYVYFPGNLPDPQDNIEKAFLLSAHMDTVSPGNGKKAVMDESGVITSEGETVLGADDLSGVAEIMEFLRILQENDLPHPDIEVLFAPAEETYCQGSRLFDYSKIQSKIAYVLDLGGDIGRAAYAAPGIYSLYIKVHGRASHAGSAPEKGIHALYIASKAIASLPYGHVDEGSTVNIGTIEGGMGRNIVPEEIYLSGEVRSVSKEKAKYWIDEISRVFEECANEVGGRVEVLVEKEFDAYCLEEEETVIAIFKEAALELGIESQLVRTYGGSDANNFNDHGIRSLVIANAMNQIHTLQESSNIHDMVKVCELLLLMNQKRLLS